MKGFLCSSLSQHLREMWRRVAGLLQVSWFFKKSFFFWKKTPINQTKLLLVFPMEDFWMHCSAGSKPRLWRPDPSSFHLWGCSRLNQHLWRKECGDWLVCIYSDCVETKISQMSFYSGVNGLEKLKNTGCKLVILELGYRYSLFLVWCRGEGKENFWEVFHGFLQIPF